jgi:hypothetical protein
MLLLGSTIFQLDRHGVDKVCFVATWKVDS